MKEYTKDALRISGIYVILSSLWILFSDQALLLITKDPKNIARMAMYKGWGFVFLTGFLLFFVLKRRLALLNTASLENARLFKETQRRLEHIQALHSIDMAISGHLEDKDAFEVALDSILRQLKVEATSILRYDRLTHRLEFAAGRGFAPSNPEISSLTDDVLPGEAIKKGHTLHIAHIANVEGSLRARGLAGQGFDAYYAIPLLAKGELLGVLELFSRSAFDEDREWKEFLDTLAAQTAVAFDNLELVRGLEKSNTDLTQAYDATIEALSFALDLKDSGTNWHSKRVAELSLRVAKALGLGEEDLIQIRRGALLHDIGKMGIPDSILLKPGPLDANEMEVMKRHPFYAWQMLSRIGYLQPALDIPYAHHEKWDGSGYPRGLKGEDIPLSARIFAVVDVFDALTSDRPYRQAWPAEKALAEIRAQSGRHFDPRVAEAFFTVAPLEASFARGGGEAAIPEGN